MIMHSFQFTINMSFSMCVLFYSSFVCISAYANVYSKSSIIKQNIRIILIAGVPKSQAALVYLITAHHLCAQRRQTATLRRPRALLPAIIGGDQFAARNKVREPCLFATATCLLPPAAAVCYICYICYCRLLCENQAGGCLGLETILGRV